MAITVEEKRAVMEQYGRTKNDTGSPEVQVALLTNRIVYLTGHFRTHKKDNHSRLGLLKMVARRRRLLNYIKSKNLDSYKTLIQSLKIRK